jgi:hypothetical protein
VTLSPELEALLAGLDVPDEFLDPDRVPSISNSRW